MFEKFLSRYGVAFAISIAVWLALISNTINDPESFWGDTESTIWAIIGHLVVAGANVGIFLHARGWYIRTRDANRKAGGHQ